MQENQEFMVSWAAASSVEVTAILIDIFQLFFIFVAILFMTSSYSECKQVNVSSHWRWVAEKALKTVAIRNLYSYKRMQRQNLQGIHCDMKF